jgi:hypothetical protein
MGPQGPRESWVNLQLVARIPVVYKNQPC